MKTNKNSTIRDPVTPHFFTSPAPPPPPHFTVYLQNSQKVILLWFLHCLFHPPTIEYRRRVLRCCFKQFTPTPSPPPEKCLILRTGKINFLKLENTFSGLNFLSLSNNRNYRFGIFPL